MLTNLTWLCKLSQLIDFLQSRAEIAEWDIFSP